MRHSLPSGRLFLVTDVAKLRGDTLTLGKPATAPGKIETFVAKLGLTLPVRYVLNIPQMRNLGLYIFNLRYTFGLNR